MLDYGDDITVKGNRSFRITNMVTIYKKKLNSFIIELPHYIRD